MDELQAMEQESRVLRWGGLGGALGGVLYLVSMVVAVAGPVGMEEPADLAGWVTRFPDIRAARIVENGLYLAGLILGVTLFLALYRALHRTNLAPALFGSVLGILGLTVLMAGALPHVATAPLSELYHAPGATPADQATLVILWQAIWAIDDMLLAVGFILVPIGLFALGVAMFGAPGFGLGSAGLSLVLGVIGLIAAIFNMIDASSMIAVGAYFAIIIFHLVLGWKVYGLSRAT